MSVLLTRVAPLLIALLTGLAGGGWFGYRSGHNACVADQVKASAKVTEVVDKKDEAGFTVGVKTEAQREQVKTYFREVRHAAAVLDSHPPAPSVNPDCALDADSLRLWNAANAGPGGASPSEFDAALPTASSTDGRESTGDARQPYSDGGTVPRLRDEVTGLD